MDIPLNHDTNAGYGIINHSFDQYAPFITGRVGGRRSGVLVAQERGKVTNYSILALEDRGTIFVEPGTEVYEGMIVGEHNRENDLTVNITKEKALTNVRSANKDNTVNIRSTRQLTLEEAIQFLNDDEYCEVTPDSVRLRKKILNKNERERDQKRAKKAKKNEKKSLAEKQGIFYFKKYNFHSNETKPLNNMSLSPL